MKLLEDYFKPEKDFFRQRPEKVAKELLGGIILRKEKGKDVVGGKIVETEAYLSSGDKAAHNKYGKTQATQALFMDGGTIYIHSMRQYYGMDIVTENENKPSSVLIRAIEPMFGLDIMRKNRKTDNDYHLMDGPGKFCQALGIDKRFNKVNIVNNSSGIELFLPKDKLKPNKIIKTKRIGITKNKEPLLRFVVSDNKFASFKK